MSFSTNTVLFYIFLFICLQCQAEKTEIPTNVSTKADLEISVKDNLKSMNIGYIKSQMDKVSFLCKNDVYELLMAEFPEATTRWKYNENNFAIQPIRMTYRLSALIIQNLAPSDSGVYQCDVVVSSDRHFTVAVYSLVVGEDYTGVYTGDDLKLDCHSSGLGKLFPKAIRTWTRNDKQVTEKAASSEGLDSFPDISNSTAGVWTCETKDGNRTWTTARYKVNVKPPLPLMKRIRRYTKTHKKETIAIIGCVCFAAVSIINIFTSLLDKLKSKKFKELDYYKQSLGFDGMEPLLNQQPEEDNSQSTSSSSSSDSDSSDTS